MKNLYISKFMEKTLKMLLIFYVSKYQLQDYLNPAIPPSRSLYLIQVWHFQNPTLNPTQNPTPLLAHSESASVKHVLTHPK